MSWLQDSLHLTEVQGQELLTGRNKLLRRFAEIRQERMDIIRRIHVRMTSRFDETQSCRGVLVHEC